MSGGNQQTLIVGRWARTCHLALGLAQVEEQFLVVGRGWRMQVSSVKGISSLASG